MSKELWIDPAGGSDVPSQIFVFTGPFNVEVLSRKFNGVNCGEAEEEWICATVAEHNPSVVYWDMRSPGPHIIRGAKQRIVDEDWRKLATRLSHCGKTREEISKLLLCDASKLKL